MVGPRGPHADGFVALRAGGFGNQLEDVPDDLLPPEPGLVTVPVSVLPLGATVPVSELEEEVATVPLRLVLPDEPLLSVPVTVDCAKAVEAIASKATEVMMMLIFFMAFHSSLGW